MEFTRTGRKNKAKKKTRQKLNLLSRECIRVLLSELVFHHCMNSVTCTSSTCLKCFQEEDEKEALAIAMKRSMAEQLVSIGIS